MNNPKVVAVVSGLAALYLGYSIFVPGQEAPGPAVSTLNWVFFLMAAVACIGSIVQIARGSKS
jgi:hypothetical protein